MKIPSKYGTYKPSRPVLVRATPNSPWKLDTYCRYLPMIDKHYCMTGIWKYCIPFTEASKHFLNTFKDVEFECTNVILDAPVSHHRHIAMIHKSETSIPMCKRVRPILL